MAAVELRHIAQILPGHPFRSGLENHLQGGFIVVQPRDLGPDGRVDLASAVRQRTLPGLAPTFLHERDIVLQPRGTRFSAALFGGTEVTAVAAAPLCIIRVDRARAQPEYVLAMLLSPSTQTTLRQAAVGTYVPQVSRQAIENLRIELPDLTTQTRLANLAALGRRERELMDRLRDARARFYELVLAEAAKKSPEAHERSRA